MLMPSIFNNNLFDDDLKNEITLSIYTDMQIKQRTEQKRSSMDIMRII